jgi:hypothetical protein
VEVHFGANARQRLRQEVRPSHPVLVRSERGQS